MTTSVGGGLLLAAALITLNWSVGLVSARSPKVERWIEGVPVLLARDGQVYREVLRRELGRRAPGRVSLSLVTDPYQGVEREARITRRCLETLAEAPAFTVSILTRSPLVTRDLDILKEMPDASVGFSIPTDDERVRSILEP